MDYSDFNSKENLILNLEKAKNNLENNSLEWSHGNWIQDILARMGLHLNERNSLLLIGGVFISILVIVIIFIFCFGDNTDEDLDIKKKEFLEKLTSSNELTEEEKKLILESKNFDSLVGMGFEKIIESMKMPIDEGIEAEDNDIIVEKKENKEDELLNKKNN